MGERLLGGIPNLKETRRMHPSGVFVYYFHDVARHVQLRSTLQKVLPNFLVSIAPTTFTLFPADMGVQVGDTYLGYSIGMSYAAEESMQHTAATYDEIRSELPEHSLGSRNIKIVEGGDIVPIANTNTWLFGQPIEPEQEALYRANGIEPLVLLGLVETMDNLRETDSHDEWLYRNSHIDVIATGFRRADGSFPIYMDEVALERWKALGFTPPANVIAFDHALALRGGCNIQYMGSVALVPSKAALGAIAQDLIQNGYEIVELGEDQVSHNAGVKCRSLVMKWRNE